MAFMEFKESRCNRQNSDNLQTLTNMCQKRLETTFPNKTFETFVGSADFAAKMYFSGGYMCKIRRECKIIMAFASPNQEDEPESPTEPTNPPDTQPTGAPETNPTPTPPEAPLPTPTANPYYPVNPNPDMNPEDLFGLLARFLCFSGDTEVLTLDGGYKRLYDLNVGDYVLSSNVCMYTRNSSARCYKMGKTLISRFDCIDVIHKMTLTC
uniref:Ground-like domain-containing protein n=1 Tax=Acrobeloides nanus TaxID=290746 RepID=A0A914C067_9BILA